MTIEVLSFNVPSVKSGKGGKLVEHVKVVCTRWKRLDGSPNHFMLSLSSPQASADAQFVSRSSALLCLFRVKHSAL